MRKTKQRNIILKVLKNSGKLHPFAEWIYSEVKKELPNISLGTIYRNLGMMLKNGEVGAITCGWEGQRFDANIKKHYHLICTSCATVFDMETIDITHFGNEIEKQTGFKVQQHCAAFKGLCSECQKKSPENAHKI